MLFKKITPGFVIQTFNDAGECIEQNFTAGDDVEYETEDGDPINVMDMPLGGNEYCPFEMVQPIPSSKEKTVEISIFNRSSIGMHSETVEYTTMSCLKKKVDDLIDDLPFHKVTVELTPSWQVTDEEKEALKKIEEE